ncbi:Hypothetical protein PHPALM_2446 [Phytophthora palmivora]|uniref:Uncharacterized protein n=1 Tax=Phytophthora palmivora TaxID=4796 RepID=A0A2P4YPX8_9STRA|nr:Hypothetical protein PHPALM_2446 [Phytophthora palmivora]
MVGSESARKGRDADSGSGMASRSSRRLKGQLPEKHEDLDTIMRRARQANAAKRKAAQEVKELPDLQEEDSGSSVEDAHHASLNGGDREGDPEQEESGSDVGSEEEDSGSEGDLKDEGVLDESDQEESGGEESEVVGSDAEDSRREATEDEVDEIEAPAEDRVLDSSPPKRMGPDVVSGVREGSPRGKQEDHPLSPVQEDTVL